MQKMKMAKSLVALTHTHTHTEVCLYNKTNNIDNINKTRLNL